MPRFRKDYGGAFFAQLTKTPTRLAAASIKESLPMLTANEARALLRAAAGQLAEASMKYSEAMADADSQAEIAQANVQATGLRPYQPYLWPLSPSPSPRRLSPLKRRILAVADPVTPQKGVTLAARVNAKFGTKHQAGGSFRAALAELVDAGLLVKGEDGWGYRLAGE